MPDSQIAKIYELLDDFDTAMLITQNRNHQVHARPMAIARVEPDCRLWFFTARDTAKVHEIEDDQRVLIACQHDHNRYVTLCGTAELVADPVKARELWKESYKTWFPRGADDPSLLLLLIHPQEAEYWDNQGLKGVRYAFQAVKAYASGTTPHIKEGEQHGKVTLT